jgi:hypothetical protein
MKKIYWFILILLLYTIIITAVGCGGGNVEVKEHELPICYKHLLLLYTDVDVTYEEEGEQKSFKGKMSESLKKAVIDAFENLPNLVLDGSNGNVESTCEVVVVEHPLTKISPFYNTDLYWVPMEDVADDLSYYAPKGKYDSVHVIWHSGGHMIPSYFGLGGMLINNGTTTYSTLIAGEESWWKNETQALGEPILHEWLHGVAYFLLTKGYNIFPFEDLHGAEHYGYQESETEGWMPWYRAYMQCSIWDEDEDRYVGISKEAWALGTPTGN